MGIPTLVWAFIVMAGFLQDSRGEKPKMFSARETIFVKLYHELRISCYSKEAKLQFAFPENTVMIRRSDYEILSSENGTYTFLRSHATTSDTGWYACAEEGIEIDNHFSNINHTHEDISWIYVYVTGSIDWFVDIGSEDFPRTIIVVAGSTVVVPCRPTSPVMYVELWQNFKPVLMDGRAVEFDPKIGFIMKKVDFEGGEAILQCKIYNHVDNYILRWSNTKPTMITAGDELVLQEGDELRIECYSETKLSFLFPEGFSNSSRYEIFANKNGVNTFLRRTTVADDTGWYGCAGEGIQNDIPYFSINTTKKEISWIYVYVNSTNPITSGLQFYKYDPWNYFLIVFVSCRPTSPGLHIQLSWRRGSILEPIEDVLFHPKLGLIIGRPLRLVDVPDVIYCTTNDSVNYVSKPYNLTATHEVQHKFVELTIVDVEDPSTSTDLIIRMTGEDLRLLCEAVTAKVILFRQEWTAPSTVSGDRVEYNWTRADDWFENSVYLKRKRLMMTIKNTSETDSGEYICFTQTTKHERTKSTPVTKVSRHVEVVDKNGGRYMKLSKQGGAIQVTGLIGETVKWLLDLEDFPFAKISWYDQQGHAINVSSNPNGSRQISATSRRGSLHKLFTISHLTIEDSGVYRLYADFGNSTATVYVTVKVQAPPLATIRKLYRHVYPPGVLITQFCHAYGTPSPNVTWSFLNCPKFPSQEGSNRMDLDTHNWGNEFWANSDESSASYFVSFSMHMSGIITCNACNPVNCSLDSQPVLYSASDEPYFTSTNLNRSEMTLSLETDRNNTFVLECYAAGNPYANVTWFKNNILLGKDNQFKFAYDNRELSILSFRVGDSGRYMCRAENEHGKVENYVDITIEGKSDTLRSSLIVAASVLLVGSWVVIWKQRIEASRKKSIDSAFKNGALDHLNPELSMADQAELLPYDLKWEFPRELLTLDKILGSGAFGIVRKAEAKSICRGKAVTTVAVKLVRSKASLNFITALSRELKILVHLGKHINVVNLLGACTKNVSYGELLVIVEFCQFGNLRDYLLRGRADFIDQTCSTTEETVTSCANVDEICMIDRTLNPNDRVPTEGCDQDTDSTNTSLANDDCISGEDSGGVHDLRSTYRGDYADMNLEPICTRDLVYWSWQVSRGMVYLGNRKVVHGDLAARNILLATNGIVKISDFGLSKALYDEAQYRNKGEDPLPVKWMAIESIRDRVCSFQSDIWSFGIVLWEFFTLGKTPYPGIHHRDLYQKLIEGHRLEQPKYATDIIYHTMLNCWKSDPSKRPSFDELAHSLVDLLDEGFKTDYLEMNSTYMEMNAEMFKNEKKDYLTLAPTAFDAALSSTVREQIKMKDIPRDESGNLV